MNNKVKFLFKSIKKEKNIKKLPAKENITTENTEIEIEKKVENWQILDICAPNEIMEDVGDRCKKFDNCYHCLLDFAKNEIEYSKTCEEENKHVLVKKK